MIRGAVLFLAMLTGGCTRASADEPRGHVHVEHATVRVMPNGVGALYVDLVNDADAPDRLERVDSPDVRSAQLHTVEQDGDVVAMKPAKDGFPLAPHGTTKLEKGGRHVMLFDVKATDRIPLTLRFARAGSVVVVAPIESAIAKGAGRVLRVCSDPNNMPFSNEHGDGFENRIASIVAADLGAEVAYEWRPQRRGFVREGLKAGRCDVIMGVPSTVDMVATTKPYYRSGYAFVYAPGKPHPRSLAAPELRAMRIGVPLVGDDGANPPPVLALGALGLVANLRGYSVYGDYHADSPPADAIRALRRGEVDVAIAWGPVAGWFAKEAPPLDVSLVPEKDASAGSTFTFDVSMGVRRSDKALRDELDDVLARRGREIDAVLEQYGVPRR